ncbi:MAG TPA: hypothetical protein DCZ92_06810 [Elusimicrobia bacterium]|nr:hypothetical protein [Elusimicrobiota bacterium]
MNIKWNQIALGVAIGFLLGAVFSHFYMIRRFPGPPPFGRGGPGGPGGPMEMFNRELGLTETQKEKVSAIFKKYEPEMEKTMRPDPEFEAVRKRIQAEILMILTPEQAKKMEVMEERMKAFHKTGRGHGPGPEGEFK